VLVAVKVDEGGDEDLLEGLARAVWVSSRLSARSRRLKDEEGRAVMSSLTLLFSASNASAVLRCTKAARA